MRTGFFYFGHREGFEPGVLFSSDQRFVRGQPNLNTRAPENRFGYRKTSVEIRRLTDTQMAYER
jgi:hypothetical protein